MAKQFEEKQRSSRNPILVLILASLILLLLSLVFLDWAAYSAFVRSLAWI